MSILRLEHLQLSVGAELVSRTAAIACAPGGGLIHLSCL